MTKDHPLQHLHHQQQQRHHRGRGSIRSDRSRDHSRDMSRERDRSADSMMNDNDRTGGGGGGGGGGSATGGTVADLRESLLGQALEGGPTLIVPSVLFFSYFFFLNYSLC